MRIFTQCPFELVSEETWEMIDLARDAILGAWPLPGGTLAQCYSFRQVVGVVRDEENKWKID